MCRLVLRLREGWSGGKLNKLAVLTPVSFTHCDETGTASIFPRWRKCHYDGSRCLLVGLLI